MPKPKRYDDRVETKVRLRTDHHAKLQAMTETDPSVSRNRIIEAALDEFFGKKRPRLTPTPAAGTKLGQAPRGASRTAPRIQSIGEAQQADAERRAPSPPVVTPPATSRRPRRPYR